MILCDYCLYPVKNEDYIVVTLPRRPRGKPVVNIPGMSIGDEDTPDTFGFHCCGHCFSDLEARVRVAIVASLIRPSCVAVKPPPGYSSGRPTEANHHGSAKRHAKGSRRGKGH